MPVFLIRSHFSKSFMLHSPLTPAGQAYAEIQTDAIHDKRVENIKYVITTTIAIIALIKSFMPEISAVLAWLLSKLEL